MSYDIPVKPPPCMAMGRYLPDLARKRAPIFSRGVMILPMGLHTSELSPVRVVTPSMPAQIPLRSRAVVPEFPASITVLGSLGVPPVTTQAS